MFPHGARPAAKKREDAPLPEIDRADDKHRQPARDPDSDQEDGDDTNAG